MDGKMHRLILALAASAAVIAACGGDDKKKDEQPVSGSVATAAPAATEAARQATAQPTTAARAATSTAVAQGEQVIATDCLKSVKSYRYEGKIQLKLPAGASAGALPGLELNDIAFSGAFVEPDRNQFKVDLGFTSFETVTIGKEAWTRLGGAGWTKSNDGGVSFSPDQFCQANLTELNKANVKPSKDKVNGVDALKYEFDKNAIVRVNNIFGGSGALPELPDNTRMNLWVTEKERWPVKMTLTGSRTGTDPYNINFEFNLTDINKGGITIEAPR
jgi:hypothetical protein